VAGAVEDTRDAVGFGEQRRVGDGKADADAEALHAADDRTRLGEYDDHPRDPGQQVRCNQSRLTWPPAGEYDERLQVAGDEPGEQHEAQLAPRSLDDGRLEVAQEGDDDDAGGQDAEDGQRGTQGR